MRTLTNNIHRQIDDFLLRWKVVPNYTLAGAATGEKLEIKVRDEARIRQLSVSNSPAMVSDKSVYLSRQRVMEGMPAGLVRFIIAHEVGHWVHCHQQMGPKAALAARPRGEWQAGNFALDLYGHQRDVILLVRQEFERMLASADRLVSEAKDEKEFDNIVIEQQAVISRWKNLHQRVL